MNALQRAIPGPQVEIGPYRALRRQVLGQRLPLAARRQHVENAVQNLAHIDRALAAAVLGGWDHGLDNPPFGVDQITWITKTAAVCCSKAVFQLPHRALPLRKFANQALNRITTDSSDSTTSWIGSKIYLLVFDAAPEPLEEDVVPPGALAVHADGDAVVGEHAGEGRTGELRALIRVEDLRLAVLRQRLLQCLDAERRFHRDRHAPRQHATTEPIEHDSQIDEAQSMSSCRCREVKRTPAGLCGAGFFGPSAIVRGIWMGAA